MLSNDTRVLISYSASTQQDAHSSMLANQLNMHLYKEKQVRAVMHERSQKMPASDSPYDWLILVHSPNALADEKAQVNAALERVLQRQMQGVMVITPEVSELPAEWDTIHRYDASTSDNENRMLRNIIRDMQYVKVPYTAKAGRLQRSPIGGRSPLGAILSPRLAIVASLILVLLVGGVPLYLYLNRFAPHPASTLSSVGLTATASTHLKTQTAIASSTPSPQDKQTRFRDITQKRPNVTGFRPQEAWDQNDTCITIETSYKASAVAASQGYTPCMAQHTTLQNFAYQISMNISGDAGGVIFRSQNNLQAFYRASLTLSQQGLLFTAVHCVPGQCATNNPNDGSILDQRQLPNSSDQPQVVTLTIIAQGNSIDLYVNGQFIITLQDPAPASGQIGVYAASLSQTTTVIFTDLRIWVLPPPPATIPPELHDH
ncbi:MAG TPA: hypothetical protein VFU49_06480 [Ktedonobacteraceae bacterium]|nr:hypothetical protein [Ktedonobacteraceae bacterium]